MKACNGNTELELSAQEAIEITRLEPVIIEVEENSQISSHLILFEMICRMNFSGEELVVDGEVQETVYQTTAREEED
jgi:hypothetical protein